MKSTSIVSTSSNSSYAIEISPTEGVLSSAPLAKVIPADPIRSYLRIEPAVPASVEPICPFVSVPDPGVAINPEMSVTVNDVDLAYT